jgi:hypothetical protein
MARSYAQKTTKDSGVNFEKEILSRSESKPKANYLTLDSDRLDLI